MTDKAAKMSERLAAELADIPPETSVEVVIELRPPEQRENVPTGSRAEQIAARRDAFEAWSASVADHVRSVGGELVDEAWINATLKGVVTARKVPELAENEKVKRIDRASALLAE